MPGILARRRATVAIALAAALLSFAPLAARQTPTNQGQTTPATGAISGTVVDGSTGAPIADAIVTLMPQTGTKLPSEYPVRQVVDARGRFVFLDLPGDGEFQIGAGKFGYLDGGYGRDSAPTDPLRTVGLATELWARALRVNLWRPAVISGMVVDESGEPVVGVFVRALARVRIAGRDELAAGPAVLTNDQGRYRLSGLLPGRYILQVPSVQMSVTAATRIPAATSNEPYGAIDLDETVRLVIGRYPLPPPSVGGRPMAYGPVFHPNASSASQASAIDVGFGDDRSGVDIALSPVPAVRVSGVVEGPPEALTTMTVRLLPLGMENLGLGAEVATARVAADGTFTFVNVPAGSYVIDAPVTFNGFTIRSGAMRTGGTVGGSNVSLPSPPPSSGVSSMSQETMALPGVNFSTVDFRGAFGDAVPKFSGRTPVTVGGSDVGGVTVRLHSAVTVKGIVRVDADPAKPAGSTPPRFFVALDPATGQPGLGQPRANGSVTANQEFTVEGVEPASYFIRVQGAAGWLVKAIQVQGRDQTLTPIDFAAGDPGPVSVTMTNAVPTLFGTVRNQDGSTAESGTVVVFPLQPALRTNTGLWSPRLTSIPVGKDGTFRLTSLPAGEYCVSAVDRGHARNWRDPDVLTQIEQQAARVSLGWGQTVGADVTMAVIR